MAVHAHPDDEVVFTGGTLLAYARRGVNTILVTATGGEEGEIHDPDLDQEEAKPRLREIRLEELRRGTTLLELTHSELLGYRDSGMAGTEPNAHPDNFHNADPDTATRQLVALVRKYKPEVLVSYDEFGSYGHPDHIKCNVITHKAYDLSGDPTYAPELGEPWTPLKLYYTHWNEEGWTKAREEMKARGIKPPWGDEEEEKKPEDETTTEGAEAAAVNEAEAKPEEKTEEAPRYVPPPVTTRLDVHEMLHTKLESARQHRTQFGPNGIFNGMPEDIMVMAMGEEHYSLVASRVQTPEAENDLLAGLD